jgi:hypothetical protein
LVGRPSQAKRRFISAFVALQRKQPQVALSEFPEAAILRAARQAVPQCSEQVQTVQ